MAPVLVAYGSRHGSTAEIARAIAEALRSEGHDVVVADAHDVHDVERFGAIIVGSALSMTRWRREPVRLLRRFREHLRRRPVWVFNSLDRDEDHAVVGLPPSVQRLLAEIGVKETRIAGAIDYWDADGMAAWARTIAAELGTITTAA